MSCVCCDAVTVSMVQHMMATQSKKRVLPRIVTSEVRTANPTNTQSQIPGATDQRRSLQKPSDLQNR